MSETVLIPIPLDLLRRILEAYMHMLLAGATCPDDHLMQDLDEVMDNYERKQTD